MAEKKSTIIIKKIKKGHEGHHGGAWKVAYADFVTAMMAFFLLMWLLAMVSPERRAALSEYFKDFNIFESPGQTFMMEGQMQMLQEPTPDVKAAPQFFEGGMEISQEDLKEKLRKAIEEKLQALKDQIIVDVFEGGVRIQIVDMVGKEIFRLGSAEMTPIAREMIKIVSENIKDLPNRIAVEGHTDASPFVGGKITNWELSTDRASSTRRELERRGIDPERIARVVGYADTELLIKDNPRDPRNRRISIILLQARVEQAPQPPKIQEPVKPPNQPPNQPVIQPAKPVQPPPPPAQPEEVKRPAVQEPAPKQEQKRIFDPGIKPIKPIDPIGE